MPTAESRIRAHLRFLYGEVTGEATWTQLKSRLDHFVATQPRFDEKKQAYHLTQKDVMLITYGDQVHTSGQPPLKTLGYFLRSHLDGLVSDVHILPFFPFSTDDGFSVIDYLAVNPQFGTWDDIESLERDFKLMFDGVINHISRESEWFQGFLRGDERYKDYFIQVDPDTDLSEVFRPRALPLLTPVETSLGKRYVWTTFSEDQIDLNYANPEVLLNIIDVVLFYVAHQASFLRLDAIAFLWKIIGTSCLHLPQTHAAIKLLRAILDVVAPYVVLITETNVPHKENISYFGDDGDEAQLVYNFALPPLVLHSFQTGDARAITGWASDLGLPSNRVTLFNFLASHDGIGITPARGILTQEELDAMVNRVQVHQGLISYRNMPDGSQVPYELNINYFDALSDPAGDEPLAIQVERFVTAHAIMMAMIGVPGIYFHSLFGSLGWVEGVSKTGMKRTINRQKLDLKDIENELAEPNSRRTVVLRRLKSLLKVRTTHAAFDPYQPQQVLDLNPAIFTILRGQSESDQVICLHNVSGETQTAHFDLSNIGKQSAVDMLSGRIITGEHITVIMEPYETVWLDLRQA